MFVIFLNISYFTKRHCIFESILREMFILHTDNDREGVATQQKLNGEICSLRNIKLEGKYYRFTIRNYK